MEFTHILLLILAALSLATGEGSIDVKVDKRDTHSITVSWKVNGTLEVNKYRVTVKDKDEANFITFEGDEYVQHKEGVATVHVQRPNTEYIVCIVGSFTQNDSIAMDRLVESSCVRTSTIRVMLPSSIVALLCVIAFFLACIIIGYISWRCAKCALKDDPDYEKTEMNGNGDIVPLTQIEEQD